MTAKPGLKAFLVRAVLDENFRSQAIAEPDRAFADFDLTQAQMQVLRRRDEGMLALLGEALAAPGSDEAQTAVEGQPEKGNRPVLSFVPEATLLLRILSSAAEAGENKLHVSYGASLHVAPDETDLVEAAAQLPKSEGLPGTALPDVTMAIHITPEITLSEAGELRVSFSAALQSLAALAPLRAGAGERPSAACRSAVAAIKAAPKEERREKLLDLMAALEEEGVEDVVEEESADG
jgi:hypothetical protein